MVGVGAAAHAVGVKAPVTLYESYRGKSIDRIEQDAYDRFFTSIEQRVSREEIAEAFADFDLGFSLGEPYWHFTVKRRNVNSR
jgi:hypothetical protein